MVRTNIIEFGETKLVFVVFFIIEIIRLFEIIAAEAKKKSSIELKRKTKTEFTYFFESSFLFLLKNVEFMNLFFFL